MNISGVTKVILHNQDSEESLTFTKIAPESSFLHQGLAEEDLDGNLVYVEERAALNLIINEDVDADTLLAWMRSRDSVTAEVIGLAENIGWNQPCTILFNNDYRFQPRQRNKPLIRLAARGIELPITKIPASDLLSFSNGFSSAFS